MPKRAYQHQTQSESSQKNGQEQRTADTCDYSQQEEATADERHAHPRSIECDTAR